MARQRIQKLLAQAGIASRRASEKLITAGRVRVNGRVISELGATADPKRDQIEVDGRRVAAEASTYIVLHKPRGVVATLRDPEGRPTVADLVRATRRRLFPVGRLDFATSGVLLLTNDGELSDALLRPEKKVPKTYVVKLDREVTERTLEAWRNGVELEDGRTLPTDAHLLRTDEAGHSWLRVTLHEGRNQQIRRMARATGLRVMRLARIGFAGIDCEGLRPGEWRLLTTDELRKLQRAYGVPRRVRPQQLEDESPSRGPAAPQAGPPGPRSRSCGRSAASAPRQRATAPAASTGTRRRAKGAAASSAPQRSARRAGAKRSR